MASLNFSTGKEPRVYAEVEGWTDAARREFAAQVGRVAGVTRVVGAGGTVGFYIYFDALATNEAEVSQRVSVIARSILSDSGGPNEQTAAPPSAAIVDPNAVAASSWTGMTNLQERVRAFKHVAPLAIAAVDALIADVERSGDNGGPPIDERREALEALRALRDALTSLLAAAEAPGFVWAEGEGLAASAVQFAMRAGDKLKDDPMPFAVSALVVTICSALGFPGVGGWLGSATMRMQKKG